MSPKEKIIEALMYVKGEEGITAEQIQEALQFDTVAAAQAILNLFVENFNQAKRGIRVEEYNKIYKFVTAPDTKEYIENLVTKEYRSKLSDSALEVVGIIAYKAPITRSSINAIRGKISDHIVSSLLVKGLIEEVGISKTPGNPILYGVTDKFYDYFRIRSINELPRLSEFNNIDINDEEDEEEIIDLYASQRDE